MKVTVIYNPTAGGGREALLCRFVAELERQGASVRLYYTKGPNDATNYLNGLSDQGDCVVAVGGDGTTNEVLNGLAGGVALGVFATGTANVLAKELGLPKKPEQAAGGSEGQKRVCDAGPPEWPAVYHDVRHWL